MNYKEIKRRERKFKNRNNRYIFALIAIIVIILASISVAVIYCVTKNITENTNNAQYSADTIQSTASPVNSETPTPAPTPTPTSTPTPTPILRRGTAQPIPPEIRSYMTGLSYKQNSNISLDDLSYLTIPHYDFNYNIQQGHMVVNKSLSEDVLDIFAELFDIKYPIERMELVDKYNADDYQSIEYNNTSAFNYRESTSGNGKLSMHALGRAIDINPQINPYVRSNGTGAHQNAAEYWSRDRSKWTSDIAKAAYIGADAEIYNIFIRHGWRWGGHWSSYRDYQHFEK